MNIKKIITVYVLSVCCNNKMIYNIDDSFTHNIL